MDIHAGETMWKQLTKDDLTGLKQYADVVKEFFASDEYYEELSEVYLSKQLTNKGDNLKYFLYDDGKKRMSFGVKYSGGKSNPYALESGMWRVVDLAYRGEWGDIDADGVSQEALLFGMEAVRKWLDDNSVRYFYVIFNMDTTRIDKLPLDKKDQAMIFLMFLNQVQNACWETLIIGSVNATHYLHDYDRDPIKKPIIEAGWKKS